VGSGRLACQPLPCLPPLYHAPTYMPLTSASLSYYLFYHDDNTPTHDCCLCSTHGMDHTTWGMHPTLLPWTHAYTHLLAFSMDPPYLATTLPTYILTYTIPYTWVPFSTRFQWGDQATTGTLSCRGRRRYRTRAWTHSLTTAAP